MEQRIILFGGTFDPVHLGHIKVAEYAMTHICAQSIVFVPARRSPHKNCFPVATGQQRVDMIRLAIQGKGGFEVSDCELNRDEPSYTIDTVRSFGEKHGGQAKLYWLVGADAVAELAKWHQIEQLVDECELSVMCRGGFERPDLTCLTGCLGPKRVEKLRQNAISTPLIEISSTEIRQKLAKGQNVSAFLDEKVIGYIKSNRLYGC